MLANYLQNLISQMSKIRNVKKRTEEERKKKK